MWLIFALVQSCRHTGAEQATVAPNWADGDSYAGMID